MSEKSIELVKNSGLSYANLPKGTQSEVSNKGNIGSNYTTDAYTATDDGWVKITGTGSSASGFIWLQNTTRNLEIALMSAGVARASLPVKKGDSVIFGWQNMTECKGYLII